MKQLKDYLHFYLGCKFLYKIDPHEWSKPMELTTAQLELSHRLKDDPECHYKLLLRPLSSMTEEEAKEYAGLFFVDCDLSLVKFYNLGHCIAIRYYDAFLHLPSQYEPKQFQYLLSKGFDLFGLIDEGLAIDVTDNRNV